MGIVGGLYAVFGYDKSIFLIGQETEMDPLEIFDNGPDEDMKLMIGRSVLTRKLT